LRWALPSVPILGILVPNMGTKGVASRNLPGETLFGQTRQRVLGLLFGRADERLYQRRIIQAAGHGSGAVQRDLECLSRSGILTRTVEGRQIYYQANRECPVFAELHSIVRKTFGAAQTIKDALENIGDRIRVAFVFGSVAAGTETFASDVDVLVVGDNLSLADVISAVAEAQREIGREINPSVYPTDEFCRKLAEGQHFVSSVVAGQKIFLIGDERELTRLAQVRVAKRAQNKSAGDRRPVRRSR
jgi:predicted nucleotidyltransferase